MVVRCLKVWYQDRPKLRQEDEMLEMSYTKYLIVDKTPRLEESVHTHNGANVSTQISPASRECQVLGWVQSVCVDHEIPRIFVSRRRLAAISAVEPLRKRFLLNLVDRVHVEPCAVTWQDDLMCLRDEI